MRESRLLSILICDTTLAASSQGGKPIRGRYGAMTIQVELNPELGARLAAQARAQGMPLERAAARILEEAMASQFQTPLKSHPR